MNSVKKSQYTSHQQNHSFLAPNNWKAVIDFRCEYDVPKFFDLNTPDEPFETNRYSTLLSN